MCRHHISFTLLLFRGGVCVHVLGAIIGFQALHEVWQAFPLTVVDPTKHLANVVKSSYGGMNMLRLSTPMFTWQNVMSDLRSSPKEPGDEKGRVH